MILWLVPTLGLLHQLVPPGIGRLELGLVELAPPAVGLHARQLQPRLDANNLGDAFINSLFITIPSTSSR